MTGGGLTRLLQRRPARFDPALRPWDESHEVVRPTPEPGCSPGAPDFVGVGVQKAGTSWWHGLIEAHPQVYRVPGVHKERHYFNRTGICNFGQAEIDGYRALFPRPAGHIVGEWTPRYLYLPWAARQLEVAAPDAHLIVILRDPIERFRSGVAHQVQRHEPVDSLTLVAAIDRGLYAAQLMRLFDAVDRDRVLVLQYEALIVAPELHLQATYAFLGLDPFSPPDDLRSRRSPTSITKHSLTPEQQTVAEQYYASDLNRLINLLPEFDFDMWPSYREYR